MVSEHALAGPNLTLSVSYKIRLIPTGCDRRVKDEAIDNHRIQPGF